MGVQLVLEIFIGICILIVIAIATKSKLIYFLTRGCVGGMMIIVMNCLLPQYVVGISLYSIVFTALLGMPGLMTLYILQMIV